MSVHHHQVVHFFTTPEELRELADKMEAFWPTCQPGQDKTVETIYGRDTELLILVDQERIKTPGWFETITREAAAQPDSCSGREEVRSSDGQMPDRTGERKLPSDLPGDCRTGNRK